MYKVGDLVRCESAKEASEMTSKLWKTNGVLTDFRYEVGGVKGYWLEVEAVYRRWVPINVELPDKDEHVLLSFSNASFVMIGRYAVDDEGNGVFRVGDEDETFIEHNMYVNA